MNPGDEKVTKAKRTYSQTSGERWMGQDAPSASPHTKDVGELRRDNNPHTPKTSVCEASGEALMNIQSDTVARKLDIHL